MALIEPEIRDVEHPQTDKKYSWGLRFWHWANVIVISGSLITVLINSTINDRGKLTPQVKDELLQAGVKVTDQQAGSVAHAIGDNAWGVHTYFGYVLAGLVLFRLLLEFLQVADQKFIRKIKSAYTQFKITKQNREIARHELTVKIIYVIFYLLLVIMAITGLTLAFEDVAFLKPFRHTARSIHGFCMYLILAFIAVHLIGVFLAERIESKGIVSDMINGG